MWGLPKCFRNQFKIEVKLKSTNNIDEILIQELQEAYPQLTIEDIQNFLTEMTSSHQETSFLNKQAQTNNISVCNPKETGNKLILAQKCKNKQCTSSQNATITCLWCEKQEFCNLSCLCTSNHLFLCFQITNHIRTMRKSLMILFIK